MEKFNEKEVREYYRFLNHSKESEIRLIDPTKKLPPKPFFVHSEDEFVKVCLENNGKYNIYVGLNERKKRGKEDNDVEFITNVGHDIDAHETGFEGINLAGQIAMQIADDGIRLGYHEPLILNSGRGFWIIYHIKPIKNTEDNVKRIKEFGLKLKKKYEVKGVEFDTSVYNPSRISRVAGTLNISSKDKDTYVLAQLFNNPIAVEDEKLSENILSIDIPKYNPNSIINKNQGGQQGICSFMDFCLTHELPKGERHNIISRNMAIYLANHPDRDLLKEQYSKIQKEPITELDGWFKQIDDEGVEKFPFSIGELVNFTKKYKIPFDWKVTMEYKDWIKLKKAEKIIEEEIKKENEIEKEKEKEIKKDGEDGEDDEEFDIETCLKRNKWGLVKTDINPLVNYLMKKYIFKTIFNTMGETIYFYENGIYIPKGKKFISLISEKLLGRYATGFLIKEILGKIGRRTAIDLNDFDTIPIELICMENGIFNLITGELKEFNSDYLFKTKIPIKYEKNQKCEKILNFLGEMCYPEDIPVIQEFFGFCLYRMYFIKKALILFGERNTGKTIFMNILTKFLGNGNYSGIPLQRIASRDKFALADLKNKYANIYDDLSADDLEDAGGFKIATGGGYITAEHKFGDPFQFMTYAKNIFSTNKIPSVKDISDDAYYSRWIPLAFDNSIEIKEQDNFLFQKITTEEEMSGLFNWAIEGLHRLLQNGVFSYEKTSEEIKIIMLRQNNPLIDFIGECLYQQDGNRISKELMYQTYSNWCNRKKVPRLSKEQIGRSLAKYTNYILATRSGDERVWNNVNIKGNFL